MQANPVPNLGSPERHLLCIGLSLLTTVASVHGEMLVRWIYNNIPGDDVASLTEHSSYPDQPSAFEVLDNSLEKPDPAGVNYGSLTPGLLEAPQTGDYLFWIASDNDSAFWLSTNADKSGLRKICENSPYVKWRTYDQKPQQKSAPVPLIKGQQYYFEELCKQGAGPAHDSVGWQMPDGKKERPISTVHLRPPPGNELFQSPAKPANSHLEAALFYRKPEVSLSHISAVTGQTVCFTPKISAALPVTFQWYRNREPILGANQWTITLTNVQMAHDVDLYTVEITNRFGRASAEAVLSVFEKQDP